MLWSSCFSPGQGNSQSVGTGIPINDPGFWDWFNQVNNLEVDWLLTNPGKAWDCYMNFKRAEVSSRQRYGGSAEAHKDEDGTNQNAYKHAWAAAQHAKLWGKAVAYDIMNNHEGGPDKTDLNSKMDYANNKMTINYQDLTGMEGEPLRIKIQELIDTGMGKRIVYGDSQRSTTLLPTTSANIDND